MKSSDDASLGDIKLSLPVKIAYPVLEDFLEKKMIGRKISASNKEGGETNYAEILEIGVGESSKKNFDIALDVSFKALASVVKGKEGRAILHLSLKFNEEEQRLGIQEYKLEGKNKSWLADKFLQVLVNNWMKEKLKRKMSFELHPLIQERLQEVNSKLGEDMEVRKGIALSGVIKDFRVKDIVAGQSLLLVIVEAEGSALVDVKEIRF
ncbi:DUF4403 family protein [Salegentibacter chungangensis]|uniref:DUF4403 family protein n=1 Tax=Salegentibacter chungangensis TaxID=1335724 RepID=A0ABW3NPA2_9FLAO